METSRSGVQDTQWDWLSKRGQVKKKILKKGYWIGTRPTEDSLCVIRVDTLGCGDTEVPVEYRLQDLDLFEYRVGEGDTECERMLDRLLVTMDVQEESSVEYTVHCGLMFTLNIVLLQFAPGILSCNLESDKKFAKALAYKERGVQLFNKGRTLDAYYRFKKSAQLIIFLGRDLDEYLPTYLTVCNNMALCHLQLGNYNHTLSLCGKVLEKQPGNVKCLLRRASALEKSRDFEQAFLGYKKVLQIEPKNQNAIDRLQLVKEAIESMNARYNDTVKRMFKFN